MATPIDEKAFRQRMQRVEELLQQVESFADPTARAHMREVVQTLMDFHGIGLERILDRVADEGETGRRIIDGLADDELVGSLLLLYGLHPLGLEERVMRALVKVGPTLAAHGGSVELVTMIGGVVRLRLNGSCDGCPSSALTLKLATEEAIIAAAPEVTAVEVEGVPVANGRSRMALPLLQH